MSSTSVNRDLKQAWAYHDATKHSVWSLRSSPHYLDWANQPISLKIYTTIDPIPLPRDVDQTGISALSAVASTGIDRDGEQVPTIKDLARLLYFSAGITKKKTYPGGEIYFRAASCTGALYEFELYIISCDLAGLPAGVYHFNPGDYALRLLRPGDFRGVLAHATASEPSVVHAPVTIISAGTYWRNAWKYRARTYRHFGWDNGTILANMLAMSAALRLPANVVLGFVDSEVNSLLDLDTDREVAFSLVSIGHTDKEPPPRPLDLPKLDLPTVPLSQSDVDYPQIRDVHTASSLQSTDEVAEWRRQAKSTVGAVYDRALFPAQNGRAVIDSAHSSARDTIEQVILRRGSSRKFRREPITIDQLSTILTTSTRGVWPGFALLNDIYLIINAVEGLAPGAYFYHYDSGEFECLKEGTFRNEARHLGLQQDLPGDAAVDVFFLTRLDSVLERLGNRGYRSVQLEAGILGGKLYLATYALYLGATGLTFFDDDVTKFFSPHAQGKSAIFLVAIGKGSRPK